MWKIGVWLKPLIGSDGITIYIPVSIQTSLIYLREKGRLSFRIIKGKYPLTHILSGKMILKGLSLLGRGPRATKFLRHKLNGGTRVMKIGKGRKRKFGREK